MYLLEISGRFKQAIFIVGQEDDDAVNALEARLRNLNQGGDDDI